ncbi:MAG: amylosucrase [Chloroflexi bacterium]|nr:amylosucrase [Chloroflexota bacterium]
MERTQTWITEESQVALERMRSSVAARLSGDPDSPVFLERLVRLFPQVFEWFIQLYGARYDCHFHLEQTLLTLADAFIQRPPELRQIDAMREANPGWFNTNEMMGAVCYVDLFAGDLRGLRDRLPYLKEMGITYLHLMPLFAAPASNNDGGYAVSNFREVNPSLGTMDELRVLASEFREHGISIVLDFVFNHTSDEHEWARRALAGEKRYQAFYLMFDDRTLPDAYEPYLREIFPDQAPGSFTFRPEIRKWVWTTFNTFQWDLNYANPEVFQAMIGEMLFLANQGADVLRLDAVPFVWKEFGTNCENLPGVHWILQGIGALVRIAAPGLVFKSEAIVHPRDVHSYISPEKCQLSYNPILMSHLWDALATREVFMMRHAMQHRSALSDGCAWINYVRSHDDIGWGFADEDAAEVGINGAHHRFFLNQYYTGRFPGSFATGLPFNYNPRTQDMRISGTTASLAGLERALETGDLEAVDTSIKRILLIYGIVISIGGIPLIYLGDELATPNDYSFEDNPGKAQDSRWVHRPYFSETRYANRHNVDIPEGKVFQGLLRMIEIRKSNPDFAGGQNQFFDLQNKHIFAYLRSGKILVLANFSEFGQTVHHEALQELELPRVVAELITAQRVVLDGDLQLNPYQLLWLDVS